jgi:acetone carboxylase gamma subunit
LNNNKKYKKHNVKIFSLYDKKNKNKIKKENSNINFNVKTNLFNKKDNYYNIRCSTNNNNSNCQKNFHKISNKNKKLTEEKPKKIYVRKKVRENNNHNISNYFSSEISSIKINENNIETSKENNYKSLYSLLFTIRRKYLNLFYPLLIGQLNKIKQYNLINKISTIRKRKNNSLGSKSLQKTISNNYSKVEIKPKSIYKSPKIKVNKNNKIEKNRKLKTLKKILEKKSNKIDKINAISLTKYFFIWSKYNFFKKISSPSFHVHFNENFKKLEHKKPFSKDRRCQNETPKKHIKIRLKKTFSSPGTLEYNSSDRKHISSLSSKKMTIIKKYSCFNSDILTHNLSSSNNITCKQNLLNQINKKENKFFNKIASVIQKLELKNILFKHFHQWKKKSK